MNNEIALNGVLQINKQQTTFLVSASRFHILFKKREGESIEYDQIVQVSPNYHTAIRRLSTSHCTPNRVQYMLGAEGKRGSRFFFSFSFFFNLTYSRWTSSLPSCLWSQRIFPSLPGTRFTFFLSRCKFSTLTTRQPMVLLVQNINKTQQCTSCTVQVTSCSMPGSQYSIWLCNRPGQERRQRQQRGFRCGDH